MPQPPTTIVDELGIALSNLADAATGNFTPTLRLGVTGLSRAGKTIFITALIHNLLTGGRLPGFKPLAEGRFIGARLAEYPEATIPRFAYEQHLEALTGKTPTWPESTRRISQLRIVLKYQSTNWFSGMRGPSVLNLDIVDYPGEWLLDLPLLTMSFAEWSADALERARRPGSGKEATPFLELLAGVDPSKDANDPDAERLAVAFTDYLRRSREHGALSTLPPGRFLLPGDLEGSPALTFAPLPPPTQPVRNSSLYPMLAHRYEAYKDQVIRPFFRDHFARLDRQIVLVDTLRALNAGPAAVADLETALTSVLSCFRQGETNPLLRPFVRKIDRILFAATKADHVHHTSHDRLGPSSIAWSPMPANAPASSAPRPARSPWPRSAPRAKAPSAKRAKPCPPSSAHQWQGRCSTAQNMTAKPKSPCFPVTCRNARIHYSKTARRFR